MKSHTHVIADMVGAQGRIWHGKRAKSAVQKGAVPKAQCKKYP